MRNPLLSVGLVRETDEGHRVTTFELFFDLVFVFAVTQVTAFMAEAQSGQGVLRGFLLLGLLWWLWSSYTWLGNQAHADEGATRVGMSVALAAVFVVALTIPEAWEDLPGGLDGPLVLVTMYAVARLVHLGIYSAAALAAEDAGLHHQVVLTFAPMLAGVALLYAGALSGGAAQTALFAAALAVDWAGTYVTSKGGDWRIHSAAHWSERHALFVILAIGESIVAIGAGAARLPISLPLLTGAVLGVAVSMCLWWLYFDVVSRAAEHQLANLRGQARVQLAIDAYTYLHYPLVGGIVLTALGVEEALAHAGHREGLGAFAAAALFGGLALYLAGHAGFKRRMHGALNGPRVVTTVALVACIPLAATLPPLVALALAVAVLGTLATVETARYAAVRDELRHAQG
jgi:low temperature requirement protein LtrA